MTNFKTECQRRRNEGLVLSGNTYSVKDQIKQAGGIWDRDQKAWLMPDAASLSTMQAAMPARQSQYSGAGRRSLPSRSRQPKCYGCGRSHRFEPCGYPGCTPTYCDECNGGGRYCRG